MLSLLLSRHIHNIIFTASVHREFKLIQHSEMNYYSIIIRKGRGVGEGGLLSLLDCLHGIIVSKPLTWQWCILCNT